MDTSNDTRREVAHQLAQPSWAKDVPAPVDADGRLVPLSTEKLYTDGGEEFSVDGIIYLRGEKCWSVRGGRKQAKIFCAFDLRRLHLTKPDSWEKLEEDARKDACQYFDHVNSCRGCPAGRSNGCGVHKILDIIRRAKALAGVSDDD